uniref:Type I polyketide synthase n=1 Tax=Gambierdiscus excentricus TaxID=986170 RepID=A0A1S6K881_9DINO|nr:type I polyketide synthase [Gambierdiscus excentricus]
MRWWRRQPSMALTRRRAAQYDVLMGPKDDEQVLGDDIGRALRLKGFCTIKTLGLNTTIQEARQEVKEMSTAGRFQPTPAIVIDGLLGDEGSIRTAELAAEQELCASLAKLDAVLTNMATTVGSSLTVQELGLNVGGRTPGLVHEAGMLTWDPPELSQDCVVKWLNTFIWQRLMLILCLGPGQGTLEMTPFDEDSNVHRVQTEAGMLVVLRADCLWHKHSVPGGGTHVLSCFLQTCGRSSGQSVAYEPPKIPIAQTLDNWALEKLEAAVEDPDSFEMLDSRWKYAVEHVYHKEQQFAVRGIGIKIASTWDSEAFFHSMNGGTDIVTEVPHARWDHRMYYSEDPEGWKYFKVNVNHTALCDGMELFDAKFFRISPAETKGMDPMQRQIMEIGYVSLATAGRTVKNLLQSLTAVYVGCHLTEWPMVDQGPEEAGGCEQRSAGTGQAGSIMSNRFSFVFGMNGPSVQFDTDASSGLAALETGTVALDERKTNATMSMCMGVAVTLTPLTWIHRVGLGQMSPLGRCLSFDQSATGWVKGEGGVAVAVDNLTEKVDGVSVIDDRYYLGTLGTVKINHAGQQSTLGTPHGPAVQLLIAEACRQGHVTPCSLDAIECMCDGQLMNDAVEVASLRRTCCSEPRIPLGLSSFKSNYAHSIQGSSLAQVLKSLYCQAFGWQQPSLHLQAINPQIDDVVEDGTVFVNQDCITNSTKSSLYSVMSIGWGGTMGNAICSCGVDPTRVLPTQASYPPEPMVFWPGGGGEDFPEPPSGYFIIGSWSAWAEHERMTREAPGIWSFVVTLGVNRFEEFQIYYDGDPDFALHPAEIAGSSGTTALGPSAGAQAYRWLIDSRVKLYALQDEVPKPEGAQTSSVVLPSKSKVENVYESTAGMGDRYLVKLSIAGKWRAVSWDKVESPKQTVVDTGKYYLTGAFNAWDYDELDKSESTAGLFTKELRLVRGRADFQIVRNKDRRQVFHPATAGDPGITANALGPDSSGQGQCWSAGGQLGDVFELQFQRSLERGFDERSLSIRCIRHEDLTEEEVFLARRPRYRIVGTWDGWQGKEMTWTGNRFEHFVQVGTVGMESFQILEEGSWNRCLYPSEANASPHDDHTLCYGPSPGDEWVWTIGAHESEEGSAGVRYEVILEVDRYGAPLRVFWNGLA